MPGKNDEYYLEKMRKDIDFILEHIRNLDCRQLAEDEVLLDSMQFRLIQIAESANRLTAEYKARHEEVDWQGISGLRNWIVHDYGNVNYEIVYHTLANDIRTLKEQIT